MSNAPLRAALAAAGLARAPLPAASAPLPAAPEPARSLRLWELPEKYHCPVVGTCLCVSELRQIAYKAGWTGDEAAGDYDVHVEFVSRSLTRNPVSEAMHKLLERKYAVEVAHFADARSDAELLERWRACLEGGKVAGAFWALLTHRAASEAARHAAYRDVHMLSHQVGAGVAADLRRLQALESERAELAASLRRCAGRQARDQAQQAQRVRQLEQALAQARAAAERVPALESRVAELEGGATLRAAQARAAQAERECERLAAAHAALQGRLQRALARAAELQRDLEDRERELQAADATLAALAPACAGCDGAECALPDLCGRAVLCVGGRPGLAERYRALVERCGGAFLHHDGGREAAMSRLPELLAAADAVICPTDCVGHLAYYQLKRHCKQEGKPCLLLRNSGLASFAAGLGRLARGEVSIA